jgi:transcriptional regulator with XRE-family HTH domain
MVKYGRSRIDYRARPPENASRLNEKEKARRAGEVEVQRLVRQVRHDEWVVKDRAGSVNPLTDAEVPYAEALGKYLKALREETGLGTRVIAIRAGIVYETWHRIEEATRHTRHSTLERIANELGEALGRDAKPIYDEMERLAGPCLAPESLYRERVENRRVTRLRRNAARTARQEAQESAWRAVRDEVKSFERALLGF